MMSVIYGREGVFPLAAPRLTPVAADQLLDLLPLHAGRLPVLPAHVATPQRTAQTCCRQSPLTCLDLSACGNFHTYNTLAKAIIERLYLWTNTIGSQDPMQCIPLSWPFRARLFVGSSTQVASCMWTHMNSTSYSRDQVALPTPP